MTNADPHNQQDWKVVQIKSTLAEAKKPGAQILAEVSECGFDDDARFAIKLALEEALNNAIRHGNKQDESKNITVRYAVTPEKVVICVRDEGDGFCPDGIPDPTAPDRIALPSGRGIMLMRAYMTDVQYRDCGREVLLIKENTKAPRRQASGPNK